MLPQSVASLSLIVEAAPPQKVVGLGCCADTETTAGKEDAAFPSVHGAAECMLFDAPLQSEPRGDQDYQDLGR